MQINAIVKFRSKRYFAKSLDKNFDPHNFCLLYTSGAADEEDSVDLGGRRIIKKKTIHVVLNQLCCSLRTSSKWSTRKSGLRCLN